jgi:hypothetical protein
MYLDTPMGIDELSLEQLTGFAREQLGLDIDLDRTAMAKLAAAVAAIQVSWRRRRRPRSSSTRLNLAPAMPFNLRPSLEAIAVGGDRVATTGSR